MSLSKEIETIHFRRPPNVPALEVLTVKNSPRLGKFFHEGYTIAFSLNEVPSAAAQIHYRGKTHQTPGKCCMLVEPGESHVVKSQSVNSNYVALVVTPKSMESLGMELFGNRRPSLKAFSAIDFNLTRMFSDLMVKLNSATSPLAQQTALEELMVAVFQKYGEGYPKTIPRIGKPRLSKVRDFLIDNFDKKVNLEDISLIASLSKWHLVSAFKKEFGLPPHAFQNLVRIEKAKALLAFGKSSSEIDVGINGQSLLIKRFKENWGLTPKVYQKMVSSLEISS